MPVRSLSSSVLRWPDDTAVRKALTRWGVRAVLEHAGVQRIGYIGSYARGDWGVGSDVDIIVVLKDSSLPFDRRPTEWDTTGLPVPADLLVYTEEEWASLPADGRFAQTVRNEAMWLVP